MLSLKLRPKAKPKAKGASKAKPALSTSLGSWAMKNRSTFFHTVFSVNYLRWHSPESWPKFSTAFLWSALRPTTKPDSSIRRFWRILQPQAGRLALKGSRSSAPQLLTKFPHVFHIRAQVRWNARKAYMYTAVWQSHACKFYWRTFC